MTRNVRPTDAEPESSPQTFARHDSNCIFCRIVSGEIPAAKLYEDEHCLAFMDINPLAEGHTLLIPKEHFVTIDEMPPHTTAAVTRVLPHLARAVRSAVQADGLNVLQNNGLCSGQVVMHVHFHLIPRVPGDSLGYRWPAGKYPEGRLEQVCSMVTSALKADRT